MSGPYTIHDADGQLVAGSDEIDGMARVTADERGGTIRDADGVTVYPEGEQGA
ncbi:hypothetical protein QC999_gp67 [Microbacterium phage Cressida]|uniref:Uncharacterized protein n=1 Tax=Microbacterium phage Cressida TaxID=2591216 RepID=A0A514DI46_9CAUD|nr:hypothetical protein QC999_gp67 [Microbacterium phage Cressida]QDH93283.1 hypothetical protein PBI_CRESSIDA_41 [Microbacterium phage Cressida]